MGRRPGRGWFSEEAVDFRLTLQESGAKVHEPRTGFIVGLHHIEGLKPHLPVEPWLMMRRDECGVASCSRRACI